jgi:phospholipid/cholesterol/gamma-HCH transport system substrate-binding protein
MNKSMDTQRITKEAFHRKHRNLFVGLFILVPIIVLPVFVLYSFLKSDMFEKSDYLYVTYGNAGGLAGNAAVTISGVKVGYIETVGLNDGGFIDVKMKIKHKYLRLVKKDSKARLQQKNVAIGDWEVELTEGGKSAPPAANGDTLEPVVLAPLAKTLDQVTKTVSTLQQIMQNILDGKGSVGKIFKEDTLVNLAKSIERNANSLIIRAHTTLARVDTILIKVASIGDKGKQVADSIVVISGKVARLITDVNLLVNSVNTTSQDLPGMINRVQGDISEVELMLKALQNNFLFKSGINSQADPLLNDNPSK